MYTSMYTSMYTTSMYYYAQTVGRIVINRTKSEVYSPNVNKEERVWQTEAEVGH